MGRDMKDWILLARSRGWKFLFAPWKQLSYSQIARKWQKALDVAAISVPHGQLLPHSARSGGASAAVAMGVPTVAIAQRGGWRSLASVISYTYPVTRVAGDTLFFGDLQPTIIPVRDGSSRS